PELAIRFPQAGICLSIVRLEANPLLVSRYGVLPVPALTQCHPQVVVRLGKIRLSATRWLVRCYDDLVAPEGVLSQRRPGTPKQGEDSQKESAEVVIHLGGR